MKLINFFAGLIHNRGKRRPAKKSINFIGYVCILLKIWTKSQIFGSTANLFTSSTLVRLDMKTDIHVDKVR